LEESHDFRELIPEFFYLPEMFLNLNHLNFGHLSSKSRVDLVELPKWCNSNPYTFITLHRSILESSQLSTTLPNWLDLVFGNKQRGVEAVENMNVYYFMTYEDEAMKALEDREMRVSVET
jgi:hypothetical protein